MHLGGGGTGGSGLADFINTLLIFCIILNYGIIKSWEVINTTPNLLTAVNFLEQ
jgi:hypothetical protein